MPIEPWIVVLVLGSAAMHAAWNAVVKTGHDQLLTMLLMKLPNMALAGGLLVFVCDMPRRESWPYIAGSTIVVFAYYLLLIRAYRSGELNLAYPMARGIAPIAVLLLSAALVPEHVSLGACIGLLVISVGILALAWRRDLSREHVAALLWASGVGCCIAAYTVIDGVGARLSGDAFGYTAVLNVTSGIPLCALALRRHGFAALRQFRGVWGRSMAGGAMMFGAYAIVVFALTRAPIAPVAALRETGVVFAALIGALVLRERLAGRRLVAAGLVAAGIATLILLG